MINNQPQHRARILATGLITLTLYAGSAAAAEVTGHSPDKTGGRILGGWTAFLIGGAVAGPVGAIVAGLGGAWAGGEVQDASGNSGQLHQVRTDSGETVTLRSPGRTFAVGEQVSIDGMRPRAATGGE